MKSSTQGLAALSFNDLIDPSLASRVDVDGAAICLEPTEEAAFDLVLDVDARCPQPREWRALATHALRPEFGQALAALCVARAVEAERINGGCDGR